MLGFRRRCLVPKGHTFVFSGASLTLLRAQAGIFPMLAFREAGFMSAVNNEKWDERLEAAIQKLVIDALEAGHVIHGLPEAVRLAQEHPDCKQTVQQIRERLQIAAVAHGVPLEI